MTIRSLAAAPTAASAPRDRGVPATGTDARRGRAAAVHGSAARVVPLRRTGPANVVGAVAAVGVQGGPEARGAPSAPGGPGTSAAREATAWPAVRAAAVRLPRSLLAAWGRLLARRRQAAEARSLAALDDRTLRDLGIEPDAVHRALRGHDGGR